MPPSARLDVRQASARAMAHVERLWSGPRMDRRERHACSLVALAVSLGYEAHELGGKGKRMQLRHKTTRALVTLPRGIATARQDPKSANYERLIRRGARKAD